MRDIREIERKDLKRLKEVIDSTGLFPSELLDEMTHDFFTNQLLHGLENRNLKYTVHFLTLIDRIINFIILTINLFI